MKLFKQLFILLALSTIAISCDKDCDKNTEQNNPKKFPFFYCKINGVQFSAKGKWQCSPWTFNYYPNGFLGIPNGYTIISGQDCFTYQAVGIRIYGFIPTLDTLDFLSAQVDSVSPFYIGPELEQDLIFDELEGGSIKFDNFSEKMGEVNGIVSGTFEFTVHNSETDSTVEITDGEFQYIIDHQWH